MAGKKITLRGLSNTGELKLISATGVKNCVKKAGCGFFGQLFFVTATKPEEEDKLTHEL